MPVPANEIKVAKWPLARRFPLGCPKRGLALCSGSAVPAWLFFDAPRGRQVAAHYPGEMEVPSRGQDPWQRVERLIRAQILSTYISCWNHGDESEGMWRLYCSDDGAPGRGVALETTMEKLEASVAGLDLTVSPINYRHYHDVEKRTFDDELDKFFHKRQGFRHEQELRLLRMNVGHYNRIISPDPRTHEVPEPVTGGLPDYLHLDWDPAVIDRIVIGPYADDNYEGDVKDALGRAGFGNKVAPSMLDPRHYKAQY